MTRDEANSLVNTCVKRALEIQTGITSLRKQLGDIYSTGSSIVNSITNSISAAEVVNGSRSYLVEEIKNESGNCELKLEEFLKTLTSDVNNYIEKIETIYNNSLKEGEEPLYFNRITLQGSGSLVYQNSNASNSNSVTTKDSYQEKNTTETNNDSNYSFNNTDINANTSINSDDTISKSLDYILNVNSNTYIDSSQLDKWEMLIQEFLRKNNLNNYVSTIVLREQKVICKMVNGKEYSFDNISNLNDLINHINGVI